MFIYMYMHTLALLPAHQQNKYGILQNAIGINILYSIAIKSKNNMTSQMLTKILVLLVF